MTPARRVGGAITASSRPIPAPLLMLREPSLWVLTLPLSSRTRTPIELMLAPLLALYQAFICSAASSAAASSPKNARTTDLLAIPSLLGAA